VIGLQAVGLILIIAMLIIPAAAARFWTNHLPKMVVTAAAIGAASGLIGAAVSALVPRMPAGAIIVVVAAGMFLVSMVFGPTRGMLARLIEHVRLTRKVARQHLLRALYEWQEESPATPMPWKALLAERSWSAVSLRRWLAASRRDGLVDDGGRLTEAGMTEARRVVRNHRLWELFLITHADIAPSHVDRDADRIEHVLEPGMIAELEAMLPVEPLPASPHELARK
jgi:manganese/zinc/iron transport system permease protein